MKKRTLAPESARKNVSAEQNAAYAGTLKRLVDCKTVWTKTGEHRAEFEKFYAAVAESFPLLHGRAERLTFGGGCFFYHIAGTNPTKRVLLMSHHDVVDGGEGWETEPFCAVEKEGCLYGRGTVDTKTPLFAQLQAVEELLSGGYDFPGLHLYIGSSHNEECSGDGMVLAVEYFKAQGIRFDVILDEGGAITTGMIPGVKAKSAVVAVHEKSRHLYRCTARDESRGHGGLIPVSGSPLSRLAGFITAVEKSKIFRPAVAPEVKATFTRHAPYMAFPLNTVFGAFDLFAPLIRKIMAGIPQAAAMLSTSATFTTAEANADEPQFKAKEATAYLHLRCIREETLKGEVAQLQALAKQYGVELEGVLRDYCQPSSFESAPFLALEEVLHQNFPDVIVAPFLLTAGTDARRFSDIADSILRFAPIDLNRQQFASIHSANENITVQNIGQCVLFYRDFVEKMGGLT